MKKKLILIKLREFLNKYSKNFEIKQVKYNDIKNQWVYENGFISHVSKGFFNIVGYKLDKSGKEGVALYQPQSAIVGLLTCKKKTQRYFLLQARAEPGNQGIVQFGPTIQSTPANFFKFHGGNGSPYSDYFISLNLKTKILHDSYQLDLGDRYLFKSKRHMIIQCGANIKIKKGFIWVSQKEIQSSLNESYLFNTDLMSLLSVSNWSSIQKSPDLYLKNRSIKKSFEWALRPAVISQITSNLSNKLESTSFIKLSELTNWNMSQFGLKEKKIIEGYEINYYFITAYNREVKSWYQPLLKTNSSGYQLLICRVINGALELAISIKSQPGLQTGQALFPSISISPLDKGILPNLKGKSLVKVSLSDEGGRFYKNISTYEIAVINSYKSKDHFWLKLSELKFFLEKSNICSIELRVAASLLLANLKS